MYNIFTQWLTLSVIFFAVIYQTEWLEVVTLGGLLTGTTLLSALVTIMVRLFRRLPVYTCRAAVIAGTLLSVELLRSLLPGYIIVDRLALTVFLALYGILAVLIDNVLERIDEEVKTR